MLESPDLATTSPSTQSRAGTFGRLGASMPTHHQLAATRRIRRLRFCALLILGPVGLIGDPIDSANAGQGIWAKHEVVSARLVSSVDGTGTLQALPAGLQVSLEDGWKTYWRSPGEAGIPPKVDWSGSENVSAVEFRWPAPHRFSLFDMETFGYEEEILFPLIVQPKIPGKSVHLIGKAQLLVCSDVCVPATLDLSLAIGEGAAVADPVAANLIERFASRVPDDGAASGVSFATIAVDEGSSRLVVEARTRHRFQNPDIIVESAEGWRVGAPEIQKREAGRLLSASIPILPSGATAFDLIGQPVTITLLDGPLAVERSAAIAAISPDGQGLWVIIFLALLGGLVLNLMPCVLPVLSIKLLSVLGKAGKARRDVRMGFLASALGVIAAFWVLAASLIVARSAGLAIGWGIQFQEPFFLVAMILVITLFAANLLGSFEIRLPASATTALARIGGDGTIGSFAQGAFATLLATPCSAPFLGTAVGFALARGPSEIILVFTALGIGLAMPHLALAGFPNLATRLPKPGRWMIWLRQGLAIALLATVTWLFTVLAAEVSQGELLFLGALASGLIIVLWVRSVARVKQTVIGSLVFFIGALSLLLVSTPIAWKTSEDRRASATSELWLEFQPDSIDRLVSQGAVVFVDVTAEWCITCVMNKVAVLDREDVARVLRSDAVIAMQGDWTNPDPVISDYLARYGRYGIPFNIVYGPRRPDGIVLPELLTTDAVLDGFRQVVDEPGSNRINWPSK